jgi:hypothetical protein
VNLFEESLKANKLSYLELKADINLPRSNGNVPHVRATIISYALKVKWENHFRSIANEKSDSYIILYEDSDDESSVIVIKHSDYGDKTNNK